MEYIRARNKDPLSGVSPARRFACCGFWPAGSRHQGKGEGSAFEEVLSTHLAGLYRTALRLCSGREEEAEAQHRRLLFGPPWDPIGDLSFSGGLSMGDHLTGRENYREKRAEGPASQVLVWPSPDGRRRDPVPKPDWRLLAVFAEGIPMEAVCERLADRLGPTAISARLPELIRKGWLGDSHIQAGEEA